MDKGKNDKKESKKGKKNTALVVLFVLCFSLFLLLFSYELTVFVISDYNPEQLQVIHYIQNKNGLGDSFTPSEIDHMIDVKRIMQIVDGALWGVFVVLGVLGVFLYRDRNLAGGLLWGGVAALGIIILGAILAALDFTLLFDVFHRIFFFFAPGSWLFPHESKLIQLFPLPFFIQMTKSILILAALCGGVCAALGFAAVRWKR